MSIFHILISTHSAGSWLQPWQTVLQLKWVPATHRGNLDWVSGSGPVTAGVCNSESSRSLSLPFSFSLPLSFSFPYPAFHIKIRETFLKMEVIDSLLNSCDFISKSQAFHFLEMWLVWIYWLTAFGTPSKMFSKSLYQEKARTSLWEKTVQQPLTVSANGKLVWRKSQQ